MIAFWVPNLGISQAVVTIAPRIEPSVFRP